MSKPKPKFKVGDRVVTDYSSVNNNHDHSGITGHVRTIHDRGGYKADSNWGYVVTIDVDAHIVNKWRSHYEAFLKLEDDFAQWAQDVRTKHERKKRKKVIT